MQFKRAADGVFKLLEVNPRFPGTLPLTTAAGIDMPKLMVDELMGRPVPDKLMPFKEMMVVRYWTEHYLRCPRMGGAVPPARDLAGPPRSKRLERRPASGGHAETPLTALGHAAGARGRPPRRSAARSADRLAVPARARDRRADPRTLARPPCEIWPIQELTYLSPARCRGTTADIRRPWIEAYWRRCDPDYCDGPDAESFGAFMGRLGDFHRRLSALDGGFVIAVGHGQFFRAYLWGRATGFAVAPRNG